MYNNTAIHAIPLSHITDALAAVQFLTQTIVASFALHPPLKLTTVVEKYAKIL